MTPNKEITLTCSDPGLSTEEDNLVQRAAAELLRHVGGRQSAAIHLEKSIPQASGLAGGSSDAAATLAGLNEIWNLKPPRQALQKIGGPGGNGNAFFFNGPGACCTGWRVPRGGRPHGSGFRKR